MTFSLFLAQQLPLGDNAATTTLVLQVLIVVLLVLVAAKNLTKKETPLPQPLTTKKAEDFVPRHEFARLEGQVLGLASRIEVVHSNLLHAGEERAVKLHERLNELIEPLAEIRGRVHALTDALKNQPHAKPRG